MIQDCKDLAQTPSIVIPTIPTIADPRTEFETVCHLNFAPVPNLSNEQTMGFLFDVMRRALPGMRSGQLGRIADNQKIWNEDRCSYLSSLSDFLKKGDVKETPDGVEMVKKMHRLRKKYLLFFEVKVRFNKASSRDWVSIPSSLASLKSVHNSIISL